MISVRNHRPLLSGNKWLFFACIALIAAACSPKVRPVTTPVKTEAPAAKKEPEKAPSKTEAKVASIAMLLPFNLDNLNPGSQYTNGTLNRANLSLDYYQGFKLALDSLTAKGYNFKLQVFDSKDDPAQAHSLGYVPAIRISDIVIGPVFPDDLHAFSEVLTGTGKSIPIVSPLSPASPAATKDQNLVTVATPLEYHAWAAANYINDHYKPKKIFILRSGFSDEVNYLKPFNKGIDSLGKKKIKVFSIVPQHGQVTSLMPQLSTTEENIFVIPSTNQPFLMVTLRSLDSLSKKYPITVFGHPSWTKFAYLKPDMLQPVKTHVTTTDRIDYKSPEVTAFIRLYRKTYHAEPNAYSFAGYDEGMYFGELAGNNTDDLKRLDKNDFKGLLNQYHFMKKPGLGWVNTHVNVLQYSNFELKKAE